MLSGSFLHRLVACGSILLLAGASLPELVCCCNISWGPAGLAGSQEPCRSSCCGKASCCARHAADSEYTETCSREDCKCSFRVIAPAPMIGADIVVLENALTAAAVTVDRSLPANNALDLVLYECPGKALTAGDRCALFQTWRA